MNSPFDTLLAVANIGGRLGIAEDKLRVCLPPDCPTELKESIRAYKLDLLALLRLHFCILRSATLSKVIVWVQDEAAKEMLVSVGADRANIYTLRELELLIDAGVTAEELPLIHDGRRRFHGTICPDPDGWDATDEQC